MRILTALFLSLSFSSFAIELDATEALLTTLPAGEYTGKSIKGNDCSVKVVQLSEKVAVVVSADGIINRSEVTEGAVYRWNPGNRSFLASVFTTTFTGSRENIIRTIAVTQNTQYVVVSDVIIENRDVSERIAECVINL